MAKTVTALIVDDDRAIQRLLAEALTKEGFSVLVEKDGEWALKTFEKRPVDVVLLDILLPAVNGYEVARKLRMLPKGREVPLLFISGVYRAPGQRKDAIEKYKAVDFLEKPIKLQVLRDTLKRALGTSYPSAEEAKAERDRVEQTDSHHFADQSAADEVKQVEDESRQPATGVAGLKGNLKDKNFPEILAEVHRWRGSGALLLRRDKVKKIVYFRDGTPYFIKSNLLSECLGKVLVREKMISEAECEESLKRMKSSNRQQGTVLIEMGCISPPNLGYALSLQLQTKLFDIFSWDEGDFQFNAKAELPPETVSLEMTCAQVIYEGLKRTRDLDAINLEMKQHQGRFVHPAADPLYRFQDAGLDEEEQALLGAVDGRKTVKTLAALSILPPIETLRLLLAMKYSQMVEFKEEASAVAEKAVPSKKPLVPWDDGGAGTSETQLEMPAVTSSTGLPDDDDDEVTAFGKGGAPEDEEGRESTQIDFPAYVPESEKAKAPPPPPAEEPAPAPAPKPAVAARPKEASKPKKAPAPAAEARPGGGVGAREPKLPPPPPAGPPPLPPPLPKRPNSAAAGIMPVPAGNQPVVARAAGSLLPELSGVLSLSVTAEERALREKLAGTVVALKKQDYFQILGVRPNAAADEIRQAYFALAKEYHPDRHYRSASAEVRNLANEIYGLISTAYETLKDPDEREKYLADMAKGVKKDVSDEVSKILAAEGKFQRGEELLRKKQYKEAHLAFKEAVELYGEEGEFHAFLGWSLFQTDPRSQEVTQAAMDELEAAIRLNPKVDKSYLFLGYIHKATGRPDKAERQFEKAIQCNPDCTEALRELRLLGKMKK